MTGMVSVSARSVTSAFRRGVLSPPIGWETDGRQACDSLDALIYRECGRADADYEKFLAGATLQRQAVILLEIEQAELIARLAEKRYTS